jgi:hypothetical protein
MAQRNPVAYVGPVTPEVARKELERLAKEEGVRPITDFSSLRADFWPEDESVDDFIETVRDRRRASKTRSIE